MSSWKAQKSTLETVYTKGFIVSTSSAANTNLTNAITLVPGTWLIIMKTPNSTSSGTCVLNLSGIDNSQYCIGQGFVTTLNYGTITTLVKITQTSTVRLVAGSSQSYSWDSNYLDRGGLAAIRVAD